MEFPVVKSVASALTVPATLDHRPAPVPQELGKPLFDQYCGEGGEQRAHEARVHERSDDFPEGAIGVSLLIDIDYEG